MTVRGFYDGEGQFVVRFSPPQHGWWSFEVRGGGPALVRVGLLLASPAAAHEHGPVRAEAHRFVHADGMEHFSIGTTAYAWWHHAAPTRRATLSTLRGKGRVFNKLRVCIFPKWYAYNHEEPKSGLYPYRRRADGSLDFSAFEPAFWRMLEEQLLELRALGVVADLILFHPYDGGHWGFDCLGGRQAGSYNLSLDTAYLRYAVARLAAYHNVWWSLANEFDLIECKSAGLPDASSTDWGRLWEAEASPTWDALFQTLVSEDPYGRPASIHNAKVLYNHSRPWVSHISLQGHEQWTAELMHGRYGIKPLIWDEVKYEGDIPEGWGSLSGPQAVDRFWWGWSLGVHVGHSETIMQPWVPDDEQVLWWSKGGELRGAAPLRIQWFADYVHSLDVPHLSELEAQSATDTGCGCACSALVAWGEYAFFHLRLDDPPAGKRRAEPKACVLTIPGLPASSQFTVTALNWWQMTKEILVDKANASVTVWVGAFGVRSPRNIELRRVRS